MKSMNACSPLILAAALVLAGNARADESASRIAFSDPSKPGTLKIHVWHGDVSIHGADVNEVTVKSDSTAVMPTPRKDGLRVLSTSANFVLSEKGNVAVLEYGGEGWSGGSSDFDITVPRSTSVVVSNSAHGDLSCTGVSGDIDVRTMGGDVRLEDVTGGALVETMHGEIGVDVKSLAPGRPLSFTSMHGEVTIHLPADAKANVLFHTHRGVILTNFDDKVLVTKTEVFHGKHLSADARPSAPTVGFPDAPPAPSQDAAGADQAKQAAEGNADQAKANADRAKLAAESNADQARGNGDWHDDVRESVKEAAEEAAVAAHEAAVAIKEGLAEAHIEISGAFPPVPPMTGGKVVSGTLNGGGTQIQASTLNGDIILKKAD
jgi:DUF4097 and DUF4098 domain-containing protein YvlB